MSATNSTPNYGLPQYVADDKPTYLGDFNKAMLDIDTNMKTIDNKAESAESSVSTAVSTANQALENANTAQSTADTAQSTATSAQSTANTAKTTATSAKSTAETAQSTANTANDNATEALNLLNQFNLTESVKLTNSNFTAKTNVSAINSNTGLNIIADETYKVFKLYGKVNVNTSGNGTYEVTAQTPFRPTQKIKFQNCGIMIANGTTDLVDFTINTDGTLTCSGWVGQATNSVGMYYFNMLYFLDAFDQIIIEHDE